MTVVLHGVALTGAQWLFWRRSFRRLASSRSTRPIWRDPRDVLSGILRILCTGAPWKDMPPSLSVLKVERLFAWLQNARPDFSSAFVKCLPTSRPNHRA